MARRGFQLIDANTPPVYCDVSDDSIWREGNTVYFDFNVILMTMHQAAFDSYPWEIDLAVNGTKNVNNVSMKGASGHRVIQGWEFYMHQAANGKYKSSIEVNPQDRSIYITVHFRRVGHNEGGTVGWYIPIPVATPPRDLSHTIHDIDTYSAKLTASVTGAGDYAKMSKFQLEYGETSNYGKNLEIAGEGLTQEFTIPDLEPCTIYYYRISAHNTAGYNVTQQGWFQTDYSKDIKLVQPDGSVNNPKVVIIRPDGRIQTVKYIKVIK